MIDTRTNVFPEANRIYKSRLFEMIYSEKEELLELYNAIHGTHYDNPEQLEINTLERAISECIENDVLVKFLTKNRSEAIKVSIYEYDEEKHMRQEREYSWSKGHEEGKEETLEKLNALTLKLSDLGRIDDIIKAASDPKYQQKLFEEFGL